MNRHFSAIATVALVSFGVLAGCGNPTVSNNPATEQSQDAAQPAVYVEDDVAIRGVDPVAYFDEGAPVEGSSDYTYDWQGATWQFASAENRDRFAENPEQFAPQYGGYCAWAMAQGDFAPIDPEAWSIVDGKLYLNYNADVKEQWQEDVPGNIAKANENWSQLKPL